MGVSLKLFCRAYLTASLNYEYRMVKFTDPADAKKAVKLFNGVVATGCTTPLLVRLDRK
jgi:hypothetical protein